LNHELARILPVSAAAGRHWWPTWSGLLRSAGDDCGFEKHLLAPTTEHTPSVKTKGLNNVWFCVNVVCVEIPAHTRKKKTPPKTPSELGHWFLEAAQTLWPVADGSLSLRKSPCVRAHCPACAAGEGHRSYVLYGRNKNKRFSLYVPEELVPEIRTALENGRQLKELMSEAGVRYAQALKDQRKARLSRGSKGGVDA
jgi:hypothetical protein